jgi:hypothetical protein
MENHSSTSKIISCLLVAAVGLASTVQAPAAPMSYSAALVTDIKVGGHFFHNAAVTFTFVGDTNDIEPAVDAQSQQIPSTLCTTPATTGWFYWLTKGRASFSVQSKGRTLTGHFAQGQIFVALDTCNGGIGFGSFTGPIGREVAYPVAFTLGTAMVAALNGSGLWYPGAMSGNAWSCIGYPPEGSGNLPATGCIQPDGNPAYPLHSDAGDVFVYLPYVVTTLSNGAVYGGVYGKHIGSQNRGTFTIRPVVEE